ncbi:N-acetylglucosamine kinase [Acerihabitans arboris]|uniref:ATPase n=1 Tax=Acerihabitans arboris TaxID=2691583 RepID=A0A845SGQ5_9GAMM|nr:BadF/BadG/BcrA/BcrD ATPase family protein [Acerihabitans arboris]NDL61811.1 ATPase [Acerihabitans arboris]
MTDILAGIDVGGTKTRLMLQDASGAILLDHTSPTRRWRGESFAAKAALLARSLEQALTCQGGNRRLRALAVGAHGCDLAEECLALASLLQPCFPAARCRVVSDVALVAPAAGQPHAIGLIAGTGSVAIALDARGEYVSAGGWGWMLGDEGGASGLVREAIRALLEDYDRGNLDDPLTHALLAAFGAGHVIDLPSQLLKGDVAQWSRHAALVFACEREGSLLAAAVINRAVEALAGLVDRLHRRGVASRRVIAAGGVISHQPRMFAALAAALSARQPPASLELLGVAPVNGALSLARSLL